MTVQENLIQRLKKIDQNRNVLFTAIDTLKTEQEIKEFYKAYVGFLRDDTTDPKVKDDPAGVADQNIGYVLGYYNGDTAIRWLNALPGTYHPVFGDVPIN
ncbi:hypothetical protein GOV14_02010 [Candidatus Pacearchaeota archaeon]|nr:hypothetical protein [Candidatus Pacearchaeota archaeon]